MKILVLNGSPHPNGPTSDMVKAFTSGATEAGHEVVCVNAAHMNIKGCMACEYCHNSATYSDFDNFTVSRVSKIDLWDSDEAAVEFEPIENYEDLRDAMQSRYYRYFVQMDKLVDEKIAERKLNHEMTGMLG